MLNTEYTSAIVRSAATDGALNGITDEDRSLAMVGASVLTTGKGSLSQQALADQLKVSKGIIQRYAAFGKAILACTPEGSEVAVEGACDAWTHARAAGDLPHLTLAKVLNGYRDSVESGSWAGLSDYAEALIADFAANQPEGSEEDSDEDSDEEAPKPPATHEDRVIAIATRVINEATREGMSVEDLMGELAGWILVSTSPEGVVPTREALATVAREVSGSLKSQQVEATEAA